ncbi:B12-binding domain-containing radical SAM protein [Geothrix edaphica]|uniref:Magnesium-protoporphyrin IX monomethyl ester cyclase n=1 Tax=Geothrix edaphica TaxID=2927976 RepID=A0ABQ5Q054_9BACT|nr:radical SAM protein [Geothrix edaphica]GLH67819.1 magnesium-protoporphyrin IX monomethyl ester cyclase [Geothrix edaphica]
MSKVLFVVPPYSSWGVEAIGTWPPLQVAYLAGAVEEAGHEACIFDAMNRDGADFESIRAEVARVRPQVVVAFDYLPVTGAISTAVVPAALRALAIAKEVDPAITTLIGGPFPTFRYQELLHDPSGAVDIVLRGEAEDTLAELLGALPGPLDRVRGIAFLRDDIVMATETRPHIQDLDRLRPAWHLLDWDAYRYRIEPAGRMASILTSRGCMMSCSFCSHRAFWRADWRARRPEAVIEEVRLLVTRYGVESITLIDPYPTSDRARWERLLDLFIAEDFGVRLLMETRAEDIVRDADLLPKYREAGVVHLYIGAEAGSDELLAALNKGNDVNAITHALRLAREHDIVTEASFMIGHPTETWATVERTIEVAIRMDPDIAVFPVLTPMPFTPLYEDLRDRVRVHDYAKYNLATPIIEPYAMTLEEVTIALGRCYMDFYAQKIPRIRALPDGFKRRYLLSACQEMMRAYRRHFSHLGDKMPTLHPH